MKGQDVVYKDVIEPLESVSVSITPTDKANIEEYGSPTEVQLSPAKPIVNPFTEIVRILVKSLWMLSFLFVNYGLKILPFP